MAAAATATARAMVPFVHGRSSHEKPAHAIGRQPPPAVDSTLADIGAARLVKAWSRVRTHEWSREGEGPWSPGPAGQAAPL